MIKIEFLFIFCVIYKKLKMETNICKISGVVYKLTDTEDGGIELSPIVPTVDEMAQPEVFPNTQPETLPNVQPNTQTIPKDLQELFDNMPHSIDTLIRRYKSLTTFEIAALSKILRDKRNSDINWILQFYVYDIYPGDYYYGIKFALAGLLKHPNGNVILNKIKNNIPLSGPEEDILVNCQIDEAQYLIVDNSPIADKALEKNCSLRKNCHYMAMHGNKGIAKAFNIGCEYAIAHGFSWAVTEERRVQ